MLLPIERCALSTNNTMATNPCHVQLEIFIDVYGWPALDEVGGTFGLGQLLGTLWLFQTDHSPTTWIRRVCSPPQKVNCRTATELPKYKPHISDKSCMWLMMYSWAPSGVP